MQLVFFISINIRIGGAYIIDFSGIHKLNSFKYMVNSKGEGSKTNLLKEKW
ncbi:hypothetical protein UT300003_26300 [Clostridium sardiniense]